MRSPTCLFSTGAALRRVFITNGLESSSAPLPTPSARLFSPKLFNGSQIRTAFMARRPPSAPLPPQQQSSRGGRGPPTAKLAPGRLPRDEEIRFPLVIVREEDNKLSEPVAPRAVMASLDPKTHTLQVVAMPDRNNPKAPPYPICIVVDRKAERERTVALQKALRKKSVQSKEMELNWAIDPHDLEHRLRQLKSFLEKGMRVQIMLAGKRRKRQATKDEAEEVVAKIMEAVGEVSGSKEVLAREGLLLKTMKITVEGHQGA